MVRAIRSDPSGEETGIAEVAVNVPLQKLFHYEVPPDLAGKVRRGHRVLVPFGRQTTTGVCVGFVGSSDIPRLKPIREVLHPDCRFDSHLLDLTRWIARYYRASWGEVLEAALPPAIRAGRPEKTVKTLRALGDPAALRGAAAKLGKRSPVRGRLLTLLAEDPGPHRVSELANLIGASPRALRIAIGAAAGGGFVAEEAARPVRADPFPEEPLQTLAQAVASPIELSAEQEAAVEAIEGAVAAGGFAPFLLHGVTGSGKTEIYIRAIRKAVALGGSALVLVPEIALTPQTVRRFRAALPDEKVAVLHSMLTPRERAAQWRNIQEGKARAAIGARSAVFAPLSGLRVIVVDEEHDSSYKQDTSPRYSGRDAAVMRAQLLEIPVILGSATPSLESYQNALSGKYRLLTLPRRVTRHDLPRVLVVELGPDFYRPDGGGLISDRLHQLMRVRLERHEQVLLFLNRRGFATFIHCLRCRYVHKCADCDQALTYHRQSGTVRCHLCDSATGLPDRCPECGMPGLRRSGAGTERIIEELARRFPDARTARLDSDVVTGHRSLQSVLDRYGRGEIDILVGTQMIAKGLDFPGVSLVGIICADTSLHFPDFRASERTFQLITQVSGRAGRGDREGRVVVQTFFPDHYALRRATAGDYAGFFEEESRHRRLLGYPPFGRVAKVLAQDEEEDKARAAAAAAAAALRSAAGVRVLGPAPAPIARIQSRFRFQILLKAAGPTALHEALSALPSKAPGGSELIVDVDPQSLL